jgi:hypothetical protein
MPAKKKDAVTDLAEKMLQVLDGQRRLGGDSYPLRLRRLAELAEPAAPEDLVKKAAGKKKPFGEKAVVVNAKDIDSPVALAEDADQLAGSSLLLEYLLQLVCTPDKPTCDPKKLKTKLPKPLRESFEASLRRRTEDKALPAGVGVVPVKKAQHLHLQRYALPKAPEVALAEVVVRALRSWRDLGNSPYPVPLDQLLQQMPSPPSDAVLKKAVALPLFKETVLPVLKHKPKEVRQVPVALAEDRDRVADSPTFLTEVLRSARSEENQVVGPADLVKKVAANLESAVEQAILRRVKERSLPPGVGCLLQKGEPRLFLLRDVIGIRLEEPPTAQAEPVPAPAGSVEDFVARFDEAFQRLDKQNGSHNHVSLVDLRREVPVNRDSFDAGLRHLRQLGRYGLSAAEGRHGISPEEQAAGIREHDALLLFVSRKQS